MGEMEHSPLTDEQIAGILKKQKLYKGTTDAHQNMEYLKSLFTNVRSKKRHRNL